MLSIVLHGLLLLMLWLMPSSQKIQEEQVVQIKPPEKVEVPEEEPEPEPEPEPESELVPTGLENEFKVVPGVQAPEVPQEVPEVPQVPQAPEEEDDVLFGDAPEQRTKKVGYN